MFEKNCHRHRLKFESDDEGTAVVFVVTWRLLFIWSLGYWGGYFDPSLACFVER